jgi:hypothetical protein
MGLLLLLVNVTVVPLVTVIVAGEKMPSALKVTVWAAAVCGLLEAKGEDSTKGDMVGRSLLASGSWEIRVVTVGSGEAFRELGKALLVTI